MKKGKKVIWVVGVLVVIAVILFAKTQSKIQVDLFTLKKGDIKELVELQGNIELKKKETIYSKVTGSVANIYVNEGDQVKLKTKLAKLDIQDIDLQIEKAQDAYDTAKTALHTQSKQNRLAVENAQNQYGHENEIYMNMKELYQNNSISLQDLKNQESVLKTAQNTLKNAQQAMNESIKQAQTSTRQAELQLQELINNKNRTNIRTSMTGVVIKKSIEKGNQVLPGQELFTIGDYSTAYIKCYVLVDDIVKVELGQRAEIYGDVLNDRYIQGKVSYIAPKAESNISSLGIEQQRVEVRVSFNNNVNLKPGYNVNVDIVTNEKANTLYVPVKAVFQKDNKDSVFVINNSSTVVIRQVRTGIENADYYEILEGLNEGDKVVVNPPSTLNQGVKVKGK
jgi:HlyD family secretion protein